MCNDCAYEPFCGADPVFHYGMHKDYVGRKPESEFCHRNMATFQFLIKRMDEDPFVKRLFLNWAVSGRSEEHTSELQSLMRISYAVFCLKKKKQKLIHK